MFHAKASQPHVFLSCSKETQRLDFSVFDASLSLSPADYFITCGGKRLPEAMDFPKHWFQTKQVMINRSHEALMLPRLNHS